MIIVKVRGEEVEVEVDKGMTILHCGEIHVADACLERCLKKLIPRIDELKDG